jgi:hypothetical protein
MKRKQWQQCGVGLFLVYVSACGSQPAEPLGADSVEALSQQRQALETCTASSLSWDDRSSRTSICSGPWRFDQPCYAAKATEVCGTHPVAATCSNYAFGYTPNVLVSSTFSPSISPTSSRRVCSCDGDVTDRCPGGGAPVCRTVYTYSETCNGLAPAYDAYIDGRIPRNLITREVSGIPDGSGLISCRIVLTYPGPQMGTNGDVCGYRQENNICRHPSHKFADNQLECGTPAIRYSSRALSRDGLAGEVAPGYFYNPPNAACLTCDELPANSPSEVATKYACLKNTLDNLTTFPAGIDTVTLRTDIVKKLKLLFELKADVMSTEAHQLLRNLYRSDRALHYQCGATFTDPSATGTCLPANVGVVNADLDMCTKFSSSVSPPAVVKRMLPDCTAVAQSLPFNQPTCAHVPVYNALWKALYTKQLNVVAKQGAPLLPSAADTQQQLQFLGDWFQKQRSNVDTGTLPDTQLWTNTSAGMHAFWKQMYSDALLSKDGATYLPTAEQGVKDGLTVDRAVATAALSLSQGRLPAQGALLTLLLSDVFHSMAERLDDFSAFHDLACSAKGCAGTTNTEVSELWKLLAALPDEAQLNAALANTPRLDSAPAERKAWKNIFAQLAMQHAEFRAAVAQAAGVSTYEATLLTQAKLDGVNVPLSQLARLVQKAQAATASYAKSGLFGAQPQRVLRTGIQESKRTAIDTQVAQRKAELSTAVDRYTANRAQYISSLVSQVGNENAQANLQTQLALKLQNFNALSDDLAGLRLNVTNEAQALADSARILDNAMLREQANPSVLGISRSRRMLSLSGANARFTPGAAVQLPDVAVLDASTQAPFKVTAKKGDVVTVNVSGQWAPTCALQQARLGIPFDSSAAPAPIGVTNALTGSEGYLVSFQNSSYKATANRTEEYTSSGASAKACAGAKVEVGATFPGGGVSAYGYAEGCVQTESGDRASNSQDTGFESRFSSAYSTGLRLAQTPFTRAPVGSLLLVSVTPGAGGAVRDVQVVTRNTAVVLTQDSDVYLVVNDAALAGCQPDTLNALTVEVNQLVSTGSAAVAMTAAWSDTQAYYETATQNALAATRITGQEVVALRAWAYAKLSEKCQGCSLATFPEEFRNLYDLFVAKSLAQLERKVEIRLLERARLNAVGELKGLRDDLAGAGKQGRFLSLLPLWSLRNLDAENLRWDARNLMHLMSDYLRPVLDIRYPAALIELQNETASVADHPVNKLLFADWTQPYVDSARLGLGAVDAVVGKLGAVRLNDPNPAYGLVALSFPRPPGGGRPVGAASEWRRVGTDRAARLWSTLEATGRFDLTLTPDDVYVAAGGAAGELQCVHATPVIHSLGFYFVRPRDIDRSELLNGQSILGAVNFSPTFEFTQEGGVKRYFMNNPNWLVAAPRLLFGVSGEALRKFQDYELNLSPANQALGADGLSAFFTAQVDVSKLLQRTPSPLIDATELVVVMQVDRRTVSGMTQPAVCAR